MNNHLQRDKPSNRPMERIPAPMSDTVADAIMFPRKNIETRRLVSDFLYQVDMVYRAP